MVKLLIDFNADVNLRGFNYNLTPAMCLSFRDGGILVDDLKILDELHIEGADFNLVDRRGDSALHWAAFRGLPEICKALLTYGANPLLKNNDHLTAEDDARKANRVNVTWILSNAEETWRNGNLSNASGNVSSSSLKPILYGA